MAAHRKEYANFAERLAAVRKRISEDFNEEAYKDDDYIEDAIWLFTCDVSFNPITPEEKAAYAIGERFEAYPDMDKEWRTSFPYSFVSQNEALTRKELEHRDIAADVIRLVHESGQTLKAACEAVAKKRHISKEKAETAYYNWVPYYDDWITAYHEWERGKRARPQPFWESIRRPPKKLAEK